MGKRDEAERLIERTKIQAFAMLQKALCVEETTGSVSPMPTIRLVEQSE
ncbi:MAG TPA: hypothetical protein VMY98_04500 [Anaerolineae bacterium]|nr:hypothetical protein [Anaerolineae bacterium]